MAYYAKLQNNIVRQIIVVSDTIDNGATWCNQTFGGEWVECSNGNKGDTYDAVNNVFVAPQPYPSWTLDSNHDWQPPTPKPEGNYQWFESNQQWIEIIEP